MLSRDRSTRAGKRTRLALTGALCVVFGVGSLAVAEEKFENYEVRVIRPKDFTKTGRFEMGAQFAAVMNETFIYTFLATGLMTYHFSEALAIEAAGAFGLSIEKDDKRLLKDEFGIKTQIFETLYTMEGTLQWTPIYGKWQLPTGRLIYFDTFLTGGGGMTGINWKYSKFCEAPKQPGVELPPDQVKSYPTMTIGAGQRFFIKRDMAVKWDIRNHSLFYNTIDGECSPDTATGRSDVHNSITMQFGASKFF